MNLFSLFQNSQRSEYGPLRDRQQRKLHEQRNSALQCVVE